MKYRVVARKCVKAPTDGRVLLPGTLLGDDFDAASLEHLVSAGFIEEAVEEEFGTPPTPPAPPAPPASVAKETTLWCEDPASLKSLKLEQLNMKILEKDPNFDVFETTEEAIAWLSQDFAGSGE